MSLSLMRLFKNKRNNVNSVVLQSFNAKFPTAKHILWQQVDVFKWKINFTLNKEKCTALFNNEGKWLETITLLSFDKIPEQLHLTIEEMRNIDVLQQIYLVQTPDRNLYEMNLNNGLYTLRILFDLTGKIISRMIL